MNASASLCECGHEKRWHPNVGRIASWPTRCTVCECLGFKPTCAACQGDPEALDLHVCGKESFA